MGKNKLKRFAEIKQFENVLELTDFQNKGGNKPKGRWHSDIFVDDNPITLELACGKGAYTLGLARRYPEKNFVGIDIKGARIWKGAKQALEEDLHNVRFLRIYIDHLDEYFLHGEVSEIWITFPDPYPKWSDRHKRLSSSKFLSIYQKVLTSGATIHFKTDSNSLFKYTKKSVQKFGCTIHNIIEDIHSKHPENELLKIKTDYEKRHIKTGKTINYISFCLS